MLRRSLLLLTFLALAASFTDEAQADMRVGGGIHYLRALGDITDVPGFDANSIAIMGGLKYKLTLLTIEGDLEVVPDYSGSDEILWEPQAYGLIGNLIYGGIGVGVGYLGELGWQDPFFALRAGVDFPLGPVDLDVFATYRFQKAGDLEQLGQDDLNSITFGALVFFSLGG